MSVEMRRELLGHFKDYLREWQRLDSFQLGWWLRGPLYLPFGFLLENRNLSAKRRLNEEYEAYIEEQKKKFGM